MVPKWIARNQLGSSVHFQTESENPTIQVEGMDAVCKGIMAYR